MNNLQKYLSVKKELIEDNLTKYLDVDTDTALRLKEAMNYAVFNGGKRIRPVMAIASAELLDVDIDKIMPAACAVELIHAYSLVHDDLPAMDNDDYRRGKKTAHKEYDEATAILAGDTLQAYAFQLIAEKMLLSGVTADKILKVVHELAVACGLRGMAGGQMLDLQATGKTIELKELIRMHNMKTGALLKFALMLPTFVKDIESVKISALNKYAESIGLAFQIKDDILDTEADFKELGKSVGKDKEQSKATYVELMGIEKAKIMLKEELEKSIEAVTEFGEKGELLKSLALYITERKK